MDRQKLFENQQAQEQIVQRIPQENPDMIYREIPDARNVELRDARE